MHLKKSVNYPFNIGSKWNIACLCKVYFLIDFWNLTICPTAKFRTLWHTVMIVCGRISSCCRSHGTFYTHRQLTNKRDATHSDLVVFFHYFFHVKFVWMSVVIYGVVHDPVETVFCLCTQLTGYGICFWNFSGAASSFPGITQFPSKFKIMVAV